MGEFNSDNHWIYYCGQESLRRNGVALIVNKRVQYSVLECSLKNERMISVHFKGKPFNITVLFSTVAQLCPFLWDPMECSTPAFPTHQQLTKLASIYVHWISDAIHQSMPCHPLLLLPSVSPSIRAGSQFFLISQFFTSGVQSTGASASALSFQWIFRTDFLYG